MTTAFAIRTFFEITAVLLVAFGILNEDKLINFETNVKRIVKRKIKAYRRRKAIEKRRANNTHLRVVAGRKSTSVRTFVA